MKIAKYEKYLSQTMSHKTKILAVFCSLLIIFGVVGGGLEAITGSFGLRSGFPGVARAQNPFIGATSGYSGGSLNEQYTNNSSKLDEHAQSIEQAEGGSSNIDATVGNSANALQAAATFMLGGPGAASGTAMDANTRKALADKYGTGLIGDINNGIVAMFSNPAANTSTYVADVLESAKIIPPAQAQGLGFAALDPILETWKIFRNVAYLFFVVIFLVIGFMIMFRQKIGGQTVVTAQQAIPSIITALIFVTFSYAIAGLMIDLMYLIMFLLIGLFGSSTDLIDKSFLELGFSLLTGKDFGSGIFGTVSEAVQDLAANLQIPDALGWIGGLTLGLIFVVAVVIGIFKLFFELLKTYVTIIASIAFAPLFLMVGAIPGKNVFGGWIKGLIGNLAAFPVTLLLLIMYDKMTSANIVQGGFMPPYLIGKGQGGAITVLVGLGIILVMPEAVKKAKEALGAKDSVFTELAKTAYGNAKGAWSGEGVKGWGAKRIGGLPFKAVGGVGGAALGSYLMSRNKEGAAKQEYRKLGALAGGVIGTIGLRKGISSGSRALNKVGEFAENLEPLGLKDDFARLIAAPVEKFIGPQSAAKVKQSMGVRMGGGVQGTRPGPQPSPQARPQGARPQRSQAGLPEEAPQAGLDDF